MRIHAEFPNHRTDSIEVVVHLHDPDPTLEYEVEVTWPLNVTASGPSRARLHRSANSYTFAAYFAGAALTGDYPLSIGATPMSNPKAPQVAYYNIHRDVTGAGPLHTWTQTSGPLPVGSPPASGAGGGTGAQHELGVAIQAVATEWQATNQNGLGVRLTRAADPFAGQPARRSFWTAIRQSSSALTFANYQTYMGSHFCVNPKNPSTMAMPFSQVDTYLRLKAYTELFLLEKAGILAAPPSGTPPLTINAITTNNISATDVLNQIKAARPYLQVVLQNNPDLEEAAKQQDICQRVRYPVLIELIWSYWHEESMMVQTLRAIRDRFQNRIRTPGRDPLAQFEMDPLRPLNNIMWGYIQDEQHRLGVRQRAYEYLHHYGIGLEGKAVGTLRPADSRKRFLQAFHTLLYQCVQFYRQADDTTVVANANNVLWVLKDLHMLLAEGAHNQFGDLPWNARLEMLMEQWILSRPELQDFLRGRRMVPYPEAWMGAVDTMKTLQGWSGTNVIHFRDLGVFGEQILLSVREGGVAQGNPPIPNAGGWSVVTDAAEAAAFALEWRNEIEGYINAYRAVTGVDLTQDPTDPRYLAERDAAPSVHLRRRLAAGAR